MTENVRNPYGQWMDSAARESFDLKSLSLGLLKKIVRDDGYPDNPSIFVELRFDSPFRSTQFQGKGQGDAESDYPQSRKVINQDEELFAVDDEVRADRLVAAFTRAGEACGAKKDLSKIHQLSGLPEKPSKVRPVVIRPDFAPIVGEHHILIPDACKIDGPRARESWGGGVILGENR